MPFIAHSIPESKHQKLTHSPEQLTDDFLTQPTTVMNLLHTNYMCRFRDIDDLVHVADSLSHADVLMNEWRVSFVLFLVIVLLIYFFLITIFRMIL